MLRKLVPKWGKNLFSRYVYLLALISFSGARQNKLNFLSSDSLSNIGQSTLSSSHLLAPHLSAVLPFPRQAQARLPSLMSSPSLPHPLSAKELGTFGLYFFLLLSPFFPPTAILAPNSKPISFQPLCVFIVLIYRHPGPTGTGQIAVSGSSKEVASQLVLLGIV